MKKNHLQRYDVLWKDLTHVFDDVNGGRVKSVTGGNFPGVEPIRNLMTNPMVMRLKKK